MQEPMEATKWCWISWNWNYRWLWATVWGLGTESGFSARTLSALNYWGISLAPNSKQLPRPLFSGSQIVIYRRSSLGKEDFHCNILMYVKCILIGLYLLLFKKQLCSSIIQWTVLCVSRPIHLLPPAFLALFLFHILFPHSLQTFISHIF